PPTIDRRPDRLGRAGDRRRRRLLPHDRQGSCRNPGRRGHDLAVRVRSLPPPGESADGDGGGGRRREDPGAARGGRGPGGWFTCEAWVSESFDALAADRLSTIGGDCVPTPPAPSTIPPPHRRRTDRERLEASRRAGELLQSLGC